MIIIIKTRVQRESDVTGVGEFTGRDKFKIK